MNDDTDAEIWRRVAGGAAEDFGLIWDRHRDRVFRYLVSIGHPPHEAEDLTAIVFLELWRKRSSIVGAHESLGPWLSGAARNVSRNARRATRRYRTFLDRLPAPASVPDHSEMVALGAASELEDVKAALARATEADRRLLELTLQGATAREAGAAVGLTEGAARVRLSRLRRRLGSETNRSPQFEGGES